MTDVSKKYNRRKIGWLLVGALAALTLVATVSSKKKSEAKGMLVEIVPLADGTMLINNKDIAQLLEKNFGYGLKGEMLQSLEIGRIEVVVENEPFVKNADVYIDAKNKLHINIVQRQPIVRIVDANNTNYYLDSAGIKLPLSKHYSARVLVATGNIPPYLSDFRTKDSYLLNQLFKLVRFIGEDDFLNPLIEQVSVDRLGEFTLVPKMGGQKIQLGTTKDMEEKFYNLKEFYRQAMPTEGWKKYNTLIIKYKNQVVGRLES